MFVVYAVLFCREFHTLPANFKHLQFTGYIKRESDLWVSGNLEQQGYSKIGSLQFKGMDMDLWALHCFLCDLLSPKPKARSWNVFFFPFCSFTPVVSVQPYLMKIPAETKDYLYLLYLYQMICEHHRAAGHMKPNWRSAGNSTLTSTVILY